MNTSTTYSIDDIFDSFKKELAYDVLEQILNYGDSEKRKAISEIAFSVNRVIAYRKKEYINSI
jgi:hypothetical protein